MSNTRLNSRGWEIFPPDWLENETTSFLEDLTNQGMQNPFFLTFFGSLVLKDIPKMQGNANGCATKKQMMYMRTKKKEEYAYSH